MKELEEKLISSKLAPATSIDRNKLLSLQEKREGKQKNMPNSPNSSAQKMVTQNEQVPTLAIFNNTNTTIAMMYVYQSSATPESKVIASGQKIEIPISSEYNGPLSSVRYQESSYTNLSPHTYLIDIDKIPGGISSLITISSGFTSFTTSIVPHISQYEMILDGQELNNALRSNNSDQVDLLKTKISYLYNKYEMTQKERDSAIEKYLVKSLVLYYYDIAKKLGHTFMEGTFVIYDDGGEMFKFLSSLNGTYKRNASHFNGVAQTENRPWLAQLDNHHFGFDLDLTKEMGKRTILFNKLNEDGTALYIKPEESGVQSISDLAHHSIGFLNSTGKKFAPAYFGSDDAPEYSKERVPQEILSNYKSLLDHAKANGLREASYASFMKYYDLKGMGIQKMLEIAKNEEILHFAPGEAQTFIQELTQRHLSGNPKYTHLDKRFGHEVILTNDEFNKFQE